MEMFKYFLAASHHAPLSYWRSSYQIGMKRLKPNSLHQIKNITFDLHKMYDWIKLFQMYW